MRSASMCLVPVESTKQLFLGIQMQKEAHAEAKICKNHTDEVHGPEACTDFDLIDGFFWPSSRQISSDCYERVIPCYSTLCTLRRVQGSAGNRSQSRCIDAMFHKWDPNRNVGRLMEQQESITGKGCKPEDRLQRSMAPPAAVA